jgi:site-specific recombinase XerD
MYTGLRVGELLGLRWKDYDKEKKYIYVRNNLSTIKNRDKKDNENEYIRVDTTVKTKKGNRSIPLYERAIEMLEWFELLNPNHKPDDYIIVNKNRNIINQRNLTRTLNAMLSRAKCSVEQCGLHSLRHSFGSFLISHGADIKVVSELLGHKDVSTTYNIYVHILPKQHESVINLFDKFINHNIIIWFMVGI